MFGFCIFLIDYFNFNQTVQDTILITGCIIFVVASVMANITYRDMKTYLNFRGNFPINIRSEEELTEIVKGYIEKNSFEKLPRFKRADCFIKIHNKEVKIISFVNDPKSENDIFYSLYNKCADMEVRKRYKKYNVVLISCSTKRRKKEVFSYGGNVSKLGITILDFNFNENKVFLDTGMTTYNQSLRMFIKEIFKDIIVF